MASQNRQERQLMRQRGAGRNVAPADFGFNFGFGGSRSDRQQMRQRGAANRKVDSVDFGFSFTPARSRRSNSRTSNASYTNARRTSKTPAQPSREPSIQRSVRSTSRMSDDGRMRRSIQEVSAEPELRSAKRQRVEGSDSAESLETARKISSTRRKPSTIFAIAEDAEEYEPVSDEEGPLDQAVDASEPDADVQIDDNEKENAAQIDTKPTKKRKKRKSIGQQAMRKKKRSSGDSVTSQVTAVAQNTRAPTQESPSRVQPNFAVEIAPLSANLNRYQTDMSAPSLQPAPKKRKKRKSVILVKRNRRSSEGTNTQVKTQALPAEMPLVGDNLSDADEIPDSTADDLPSRSPSPLGRSSPVMQSIGVDYAEDEDYIDEEHTPEPPTPAPARKARRVAPSGAAVIARGPKASGSYHDKSSFPIVTHRMVNMEALPTVEEEIEHGESNDSDGDGTMRAPADRTGPRAVDVLAQICRETVETAIARLDGQVHGESRPQRQRKRNALEAFGADLDSRLFDMSVAVEDRVSLEAKVRKIKREKADLQARWIEMRRERERIALKSDRLRREHWEHEHTREQRWKISEAARKAELELSKDTCNEEEESLEFMLRSVAEEVTNCCSGGGLLQRMKAFNSQLEKVAEALEGRAH